jgi:CxxC motif-containing protein (DUF1111 family)
MPMRHRLLPAWLALASLACSLPAWLAEHAALAAGESAGGGTAGLHAASGEALFQRQWLPATGVSRDGDGVGPLYNAASCAGCHSGAGYGALVTRSGTGVTVAGVLAEIGDERGIPDPHYGTQIQTLAVAGVPPEGAVAATAAADGSLSFRLTLAGPPLLPSMHVSYRMAPRLVGRAAIDAVDEAAILANADPDDTDGDGISGRPHMVPTGTGLALGRFGWKGGRQDLMQQIAGALAIDMGLSNPLLRAPFGDCTPLQRECLAAATGQENQESALFHEEEAPLQVVSSLAAYVGTLEPPAAPPADAAGTRVFAELGCAACHVPALARSGGGVVTLYSDLLLHDLGPGLDDGVAVPGASSAEWRTAPLVGIGGAGRYLLHDGRAATLEAAILAHGGEAAAARDRYAAAGEEARADLMAFLQKL